MEPQPRLRLHAWARLSWALIALACVGCGSDGETDSGTAQPGIDPFCETRPRIEFCEDFDGIELPGAFGEQRSELSTMSISSEQASSAPESLKITVESGGSAILAQSFEAGGKLRLFGMVFVPELGAGDVKLGAFVIDGYHIGFGASDDGSLWAYEGETRLPGTGTLPLGKWASFRWDVNIYDDGTGTANLRFGNDVMFETDALTTPGAPESPAVEVGVFEATGPWAMYFDNVTVSIGEANQ